MSERYLCQEFGDRLGIKIACSNTNFSSEQVDSCLSCLRQYKSMGLKEIDRELYEDVCCSVADNMSRMKKQIYATIR